ncbi:arylsulfatase [Paraglaciecola sp. MB-3u-78]|uniref:arylsulfatase n=1 Tax=Paraglaciecola sp. MB-3u-78 TaxID=2058332 RepID=UPI000C3408FE|nr:arylsulfatase [Paraglaciecola sp. MB-3u-78]PKG96195.1 sulfatase [Paraglaciecola sp. MB-3u-78]
MKHSVFKSVLIMIFLSSTYTMAAQQKPNVLVVLLDDVGFMDFGSYGGDTATPNIDKLAQQGAKFSRFYTSPQCAPSRAMLMTGKDNHQVGIGSIIESLDPKLRQYPAYSMIWEDDTKTMASRLKESGYQTFVSGKWGIGESGANLPSKFGFDRSFVLDATGASNYDHRPYIPISTTAKWFEDGEPTTLPDDFYSSRNLVDKLIGYIDDAESEQPFFAYLPFMAIHMPLQVPKEYIDKYNGVFDQGWDVVAKQRLEKAIELELVPGGTKLAKSLKTNRKWDQLTEAEKVYWARAMQVNAGMLEAADFHLGRLLSQLEAKGKLENTIVIVTSDNGPEGSTVGFDKGLQGIAFSAWMSMHDWSTEYEDMGGRNGLTTIGPEWASVSSGPFRLFKFNSSEGGQRVPLIISGSGIINQTDFLQGRAHMVDILPTVLDVLDIPFDQDELYGRSLMPLINEQSQEVYGTDESYAIEVGGNASLYRGAWKISRVNPPSGDGQWHLFNLAVDAGEANVLEDEYPVLFQELLNEYLAYSTEMEIIQPDLDSNDRDQVVKNIIRKQAGLIGPYLIFIVILIVGFVYLRRRKKS